MVDRDSYPPFITSRSPSHARARREFLHPSPGGRAQVAAICARLYEGEYCAGQTCLRVAELLDNDALAERTRADAASHEAHRETLGNMIEQFDGSPPRVDECRSALIHGPDAVVQGASDSETLEVLHLMRDELRIAYEEAAGSAEMEVAQRAALARMAPARRDAGRSGES